MLEACRYFGHTRDYWWGALNWTLYAELQQQLAENPPADRLVQLYFMARDWWTPPAPRMSFAEGEATEEAEVWECPLPDFTD